MNWLQKNKFFILGGLLGALFFSKRKKITQLINNKMQNISSQEKINLLHPAVRDKALLFINKVKKELNIDLRVTSTLRTHAQQNELYAQGRTKPGEIVTKAKGGESSHNFGTALDVVPIENGKANYNTKDWDKIANIAKSFGFTWGGDWKSFKDKPHFEMNFNLTLKQMQKKYAEKNKTDVYINLT
jgi:hypothetical protein